MQANRLRQSTYCYTDPGQTFRQDSGSWVYKGEWNGTVSDKLYVEARYGDFGYYFPQIANSDRGYWFRDTAALTLEGSPQRQQNDRDCKQYTAAATYFVDTAKGSHTFKFGGEILNESQWTGFAEGVGGNRDLQYTNGRSSQIVFWFPTASDVGGLKNNDNGDFYVENKLDVFGAFLNDTWAMGRLTLNAGVRWDRYRNWLPEQRQVAFSHGTPELTIPDAPFAETEVNTWNSFAPRLGMVFDLTGDGRSVIRANYGLYWHNPGVGLSSNANQNQVQKTITRTWNDANGDRRWQPGEEGQVTSTNLAGSRTIDPDLKQPYTHEFGVFYERQLAEVIGSRVGFVYKTEDDLFESYQVNRPPSVYTVPFPFVDRGVDGAIGTADDRTITLYGMPAALASQHNVNEQATNTGRRARAGISRRRHPTTRRSGSGSRPSCVTRPATTSRARSRSRPAATPFGLIIPGTTLYADAPEDNRQDNITVIDIRAEKTVTLGERIKLRGCFDLFNIANSSAAETITRTSGTSYLRPTAILAPRTGRLGFRFLW